MPIRDPKDAVGFAKRVDSMTSPIFATKNERKGFVSMSPVEHEEPPMEAARAKLYARIASAEGDAIAGRTSDAAETTSQLKARYGLL